MKKFNRRMRNSNVFVNSKKKKKKRKEIRVPKKRTSSNNDGSSGSVQTVGWIRLWEDESFFVSGFANYRCHASYRGEGAYGARASKACPRFVACAVLT